MATTAIAFIRQPAYIGDVSPSGNRVARRRQVLCDDKARSIGDETSSTPTNMINTSPASTLPYDVLREIFTLCVAALPPSCDFLASPAWTLTQVCGHWRGAGVSLAALWGRVHVDFDVLALHPRVERVVWCLERHLERASRVVLRLSGRIPVCGAHPLVRCLRGRARDVELDLGGEESVRAVLQGSAVERLVFVNPGGGRFDGAFGDAGPGVDLGGVRRMRTCGYPAGVLGVRWERLEEWEFEKGAEEGGLCVLAGAGLCRGVPTYAQNLEWMERMRGVGVFRSWVTRAVVGGWPVRHDVLRELWVRGDGVGGLLAWLELPKLEVLGVLSGSDAEALRGLVRRSGCVIKVLGVSGTDGIRDLLGEARDVERLVVVGGTLEERDLRKVVPKSMPTDGLSLLSLSVAAANAQPIPESKHRRLSSTGKAKRRLSDARDAASRPSPSSLSTPDELAGISSPVVIPKNGKKRGVDHKCESCSKIYRHPSCLIKHRWEHTPHWRESSKYVLSKHQQVQLLEAAAILSHLKSESLPEDRSLWPSFLSGGGAATASSSSVPVGGRAGPRMHDYDVQPGTPMEVLAPRFEYGSVGESVPESDEEEEEDEEDEMSEDEVWEDKTKQEAEEWDGFDMDMD
ncbi:hypothetical protein IW262DRAFT_1508973 [Armillaria fumosa]|nr:hypothetical protein IW262DRAFT_1508973 [Armillaria fumosa]